MAGNKNENRVCVVDCSGEKEHATAARLLLELTGSGSADCGQAVVWRVSNRYYEAEVEVEVKTELEESRRENWEALLALCHLTQPLSLKSAYKVWEGLDSETTPPVNLLVGVVSGCGSVEEVKSEVVQWCLGRGVELVIWGIDSPPTLSEDDDFPESVGVARVSEALQAHMWPNMKLKDKKLSPLTPDCCVSSYGAGGSDEKNEKIGNSSGDCCNGYSGIENDPKVDQSNESRTSSHTSPAPTSHTSHSHISHSHISPSHTNVPTHAQTLHSKAAQPDSEARLDSLLGVNDSMQVLKGLTETDNSGEEFEHLFAKFADMKAHAQSLPHEERKAYAEKVVMSFLEAIGGEEEEIDSVNDLEHEEKSLQNS